MNKTLVNVDIITVSYGGYTIMIEKGTEWSEDKFGYITLTAHYGIVFRIEKWEDEADYIQMITEG